MPPTKAQHKELCLFGCFREGDSWRCLSKDLRCRRELPYGLYIWQGKIILGKARLAPRPEQTIPRLELCAAVMAVDMADLITSEIDIECDAVTFCTDSKVVLGYIYNEKLRFYCWDTRGQLID